MVSAPDHSTQTTAWKNIKDKDIDDLFITSDSITNGNTDYEGQFSRMIGLNFGWLEQNAKDAIKEASLMKLHLAVKKTETTTIETNSFNIIIETQKDDNDPQFFAYNENDQNSGPIYRYPNPDQNNPLTPIWTPEMWVGYFINNWLRKDFGVNTIFNTILKPNDRHNPSANNGIYPSVRAHYYVIEGIRLKHLQAKVKDNSLIHLRFFYGIDIMELIAGNQLFSLIFQIGYSNDSPTQLHYDYLNFVGACPPACSGNGTT
ncbi:MAG TPA: hypothetical protein DCG19_14885 [Cryomorphaceae bacterium]|mgnify:CR=1 FL=1|nr:hypothetical protein [Owenweeksia sp.]MBF97693.1 hypothetical protein [Owenweeksia sp.]HAD98695.1 hypothetical protein [Cryomorphaceae bacterium]HBF21182.1 hypothetical protein [Cryomorphaceae bacterium]HCQ16840.1 hypothetical protein [Cryomorphaceae bacterium]|tara:strand:+ start:214 stop:993 length:780 start_codon:yes stop_codon:yes gene_type:complete